MVVLAVAKPPTVILLAAVVAVAVISLLPKSRLRLAPLLTRPLALAERVAIAASAVSVPQAKMVVLRVSAPIPLQAVLAAILRVLPIVHTLTVVPEVLAAPVAAAVVLAIHTDAAEMAEMAATAVAVVVALAAPVPPAALAVQVESMAVAAVVALAKQAAPAEPMAGPEDLATAQEKPARSSLGCPYIMRFYLKRLKPSARPQIPGHLAVPEISPADPAVAVTGPPEAETEMVKERPPAAVAADF